MPAMPKARVDVAGVSRVQLRLLGLPLPSFRAPPTCATASSRLRRFQSGGPVVGGARVMATARFTCTRRSRSSARSRRPSATTRDGTGRGPSFPPPWHVQQSDPPARGGRRELWEMDSWAAWGAVDPVRRTDQPPYLKPWWMQATNGGRAASNRILEPAMVAGPRGLGAHGFRGPPSSEIATSPQGAPRRLPRGGRAPRAPHRAVRRDAPGPRRYARTRSGGCSGLPDFRAFPGHAERATDPAGRAWPRLPTCAPTGRRPRPEPGASSPRVRPRPDGGDAPTPRYSQGSGFRSASRGQAGRPGTGGSSRRTTRGRRRHRPSELVPEDSPCVRIAETYISAGNADAAPAADERPTSPGRRPNTTLR